MAHQTGIIEEIETCQGRLKVGPVAVEPVSDIAFLGCLDDQTLPLEAGACDGNSVRPVRLAHTRFRLNRPGAVRIYGHDPKWINGTATAFPFISASSPPNICVEADAEVKGSSSGGPIIDANGELMAIVSNFSVPITEQKSIGLCPRPFTALPTWICRQLRQK